MSLPESTSFSNSTADNNSDISSADSQTQVNNVFNFDELSALVNSNQTTEATSDNQDYERIFQLQSSPGDYRNNDLFISKPIRMFRAVQQTMLCTSIIL